MKTSVPKLFIVGLCAYLMQLALSLDRSLNDWELFRHYCQGPELPSLAKVNATLHKLMPNVKEGYPDWNYPYEKPSLIVRLYEWLFKRDLLVSTRDLVQIYLVLRFLQRKLHDGEPLECADLVPVRLTLSYAAIALSERVFFASRRERTLKVTHLNQNPILSCESVQRICEGNVWP